MQGYPFGVKNSDKANGKSVRGGRLRDILGALFGTPGRSAATSAMALAFVVVGYVVLLPSGLFDDREFIATPLEEWGIPGDPPTERPLISAWFEQSPAWQEAARESAKPGVEEAVNRLFENGELSEEDLPKALPLLLARAEAGIELTRVAAGYSLALLSDPSDHDSYGSMHLLQQIARAFQRLSRIPHIGEHTGREAEYWLEHFGEFAISILPLGEANLMSFLVVDTITCLFFESVRKWIPLQDTYDNEMLASLRVQLQTLVRESSIDRVGRALYGEAQFGRRWLAEHTGPGRAWAGPGELGLYSYFSAGLPDFLEWLEVPVNWWLMARVQQNMTKAVIEERYRRSVQWLQLPPSERFTMDTGDAPGWRMFLDPRPNAIGKEILAGSVPVIAQRVSERMLTTQTAYHMMDVALAIAQWQAASGDPGLPPTLDALAPDFLGSTPLDPFSGKPFGYDAARGVLWSVGADGVDTGGIRPEESLSLTLDLREGGSGTLDLWHLFQIDPDRQ